MYRFLVVEDDSPSLMLLKSLLEEEFPGCFVDTASHIADGKKHLEEASRQGTIYDAALLDFKLPASLGENPEIDYSLCGMVQEVHKRTLVIHMTAFGEDPMVLTHLTDSHSEPTGLGTVLVSKTEWSWPRALLKKLKTFLFSQDIAEQMDQIFGPLPAGSSTVRSIALRRPASRESGVTHRLALLTQNIEEHWGDLTESLKDRIQSTFVVDSQGPEVRVSLM